MNKIGTCDICSIEFNYKWRKDRDRKYCSLKCIQIISTARQKRICKICKKCFLNKAYGNPGNYCSKICQFEGQKVENMYDEKSKTDLIISRYNKYVIKNNDGCWGWSGVISHYNYGILGAAKLKIPAHRASWIIHKGEIPKGFFICHHCDNPICSNPDHLFIGTQADNMEDMWKKGRGNKHRLGKIPWNKGKKKNEEMQKLQQSDI